MPIVLCIETATRLCSVAILQDGQVTAARDVESEKLVHAEKVNLLIDEVVQQAGLTLRQVDAVAVGIGPGSYTGLRIGLSAAKGLCYALEVPIIGIGTLHTLWQAARTAHPGLDGEWWPMIDARRMEVFTQPFSTAGEAMSAPHPLVLDPAWLPDARPILVLGDGADKAAALWRDRAEVVHLPGIRPNASAMAREAGRRFEAGTFDDLAYLVPDYGKGVNVTQPRERGTG